jgi:hypothetical protein
VEVLKKKERGGEDGMNSSITKIGGFMNFASH